MALYIKERHKLSKINYVGLKKAEENKIKEKMNLLPGSQVTDLMKSNLKMQIEKYLKEKGYYNTNIRIIQLDDPEHSNFVILDAIVEKHNKIKIDEIIARTSHANSRFPEKQLLVQSRDCMGMESFQMYLLP